MTDITNYYLSDTTARTSTATTNTELAAHTIAWSSLSSAGFADGDDVIVVIKSSLEANSTARHVIREIARGTTFGGASQLAYMRSESAGGVIDRGMREVIYLDRLTLTVNENFYHSLYLDAAAIARTNDFMFLMLKLDDLAADDFRYADAADGTTADDTAYEDGASITLPSGGGDDWLLLGAVDWAPTSFNDTGQQQIEINSTGYMEHIFNSEDADEELSFLSVGYHPGAGASDTITMQYRNASGSSHVVDRSAIFALRMEAFTDHIGNMDSDNITSSGSTNTFVETNSVTYNGTAIGDACFFAQTMCATSSTANKTYHRVQDDNTDIISGLGQTPISSYAALGSVASSSFGVASIASGVNTIDVDHAEENSATAYDLIDHALVVFSMDLAAAPPSGFQPAWARNQSGIIGQGLR